MFPSLNRASKVHEWSEEGFKRLFDDRWKCSDDNSSEQTIIVLFARREVAICATSWKVLYRKFVYFSTSEEFPPASNYEVVILLIEFLDETSCNSRDISTLRISLFLFPLQFTFYLPILSPLVVKSKEKWYVFYSLPLMKFKIE